MKLEYKFTIVSFISLGLVISFLYVYWWGFLFVDGEYYYVNLNNYREFLGEFIGLHIIFFIILIFFITFFRKVIKEGFRGWK